MRDEKGKLGWIASQRFVVALGLAGVCLVGVTTAEAQVADSTRKLASTRRLVTVEEGRSIVSAAWEQPARGAQDCSHLVHQIYLNAGFEYPYMSSFEIYAGNKSFARVKFPHAGDLIVWPGHMGIVVDPLKHSFYSLVRTGLEQQDYEAPYWKSRGAPRFYRYKVQNPGVLSVMKTPVSPHISNSNRQRNLTVVTEDRSSHEDSASDPSPKTASEPTAVIYGPPAPADLAKASPAFEIPSRIVIVAGSKPPTREEVAEGISELSDAVGNVLRSDDPSKVQLPVVIVEQFSVERVEIKRDHGWAQLQIDSKMSIGGGTTQLKGRREKIRLELRHTQLGWEAVTPSDRTYVSHDVAVRNLAAQLARLAESDGAAAHLEPVLHQESQLANLLSALLGNN
jgi:hypothetical protein